MFCSVSVEDSRSNLHIWWLWRVYVSEQNLDFCSAFEVRLLVYQDKWFVSASNWNSGVVWHNFLLRCNFYLYKVLLSEIFVNEILVSMKATSFFQKVLFVSLLTRYVKLLCCKCFVRVLCREYHESWFCWHSWLQVNIWKIIYELRNKNNCDDNCGDQSCLHSWLLGSYLW